jgi:anti-sigma regulatory factor (Ser/Thr protein kinase)
MNDDADIVTTQALSELDAGTSTTTSLPPHPSSIGAARRFVRTALMSAGRHELLEDAELAVSEVVTNAVVHAGTRVDIKLVVGPVLARIEVEDGSPNQPRARRYAITASTGRGLGLVNDVAADWGVRPTERGKTVWFELAPTLASRDDRLGGEARASGTQELGSPSGGSATDEPPASSGVELLGVPVLLYGAWRQHAEALLREYMLATLDEGKPEDAVQVHAEASDALAVLDKVIPVMPPTDTPAAALAAALSPAASPARIRLVVPHDSRRHFLTLDRALEDALERAEAGAFLTPQVQPELRELRRWLCDQVTSQCLGAEPAPWNPRDTRDVSRAASADSAVDRLAGWDADPVTCSERALLAVDDSGLIVAVSRPAQALLGHDDDASRPSDQLPGRRLVTLIPQRFRQAHLAGFTLHLLTGSGALLDTAVTVPVLHRDGTELPVRLTVHEDHVADGRPVFIAELEPTTPLAR